VKAEQEKAREAEQMKEVYGKSIR
jgi:predicted ribosome quality control (RQC) complex YloA/Tae2 family protein